jgi:hypothetical protein
MAEVGEEEPTAFSGGLDTARTNFLADRRALIAIRHSVRGRAVLRVPGDVHWETW